MTSEFGGSADFVTSMGPDSFVMLYSCPSCNTAPLRMKDWLYGRPSMRSPKTQYHCPNCAARWKWGSGRSERWIMLYHGEQIEPDYYVWGNSHTQEIENFCEEVTSWMKVVNLTSVVENLCKDHHVSLSVVLQAIGAINQATEERCKLHMVWERKPCADPRLGDFPCFVPICKDDRLSVRHFGQEVHIGFKDPKTRALSSQELIAICEVMLSLVDPSNYPTSTKALKKTSDRNKWYATFVNEVTNQTRYTQALSSDEDAGDLHL
eukprot:5300047-Amphidinium_carterae.1